VEARDYSMYVNVLQQIKTFGTVPGSGFVDYAQSLITQNKHKNRDPHIFSWQKFPPPPPPPPPTKKKYKKLNKTTPQKKK